MLLNSVAAAALLATLALAVASASLSMARAAIIRGAQNQLQAGYQRAESVLQSTIAAQIAAGASPAPSFTPLPAACSGGAGACTFSTSETIDIVTAATPFPAASCDPSAQSCALNTDQNAYAAEGRIAARITVSVSTGDGVTLAKRSSDVIVRTFQSPPFATIASASQADDGGILSAADACAAPTPGIVSDSGVRVAYRNIQNQACIDGTVWAQSSYGVLPAAPAGWSQ